ncbi:MAG: ATP-binding cassette domain-containing protein [Firmicutes bacterium]|nr:ATP-binding cassette domain-containing protein [Bacillota bacterium]
MEPILQTFDLTKRYGLKAALDSVNMTVERGDIYGFIGRNGAGKTTLMRVVLGMTDATSGRVELFGGRSLRTTGMKIGSLIESPAFYHNCSAKENLVRFSIISGADKREVDKLLEIVGLGDTGNKRAGQFSLGMKQRLGIAIALLNHPEFLVLDEPINGLDPAGIMQIRNLLHQTNQEYGTTILISSHLLDELGKLATKYGIINEGKLVEEVAADELERRCEQKLRIRVDDPARAREILSARIPMEDMTIGDGELILNSHLDESAEINHQLALSNLMVSGIEHISGDLEQYFVERIGG